jgi:hypothetical protein
VVDRFGVSAAAVDEADSPERVIQSMPVLPILAETTLRRLLHLEGETDEGALFAVFVSVETMQWTTSGC